MKEVDDFLQFLFDNESDDRIIISKKLKYGYRYYYITLNIDEKIDEDDLKLGGNFFRISDSLEIILDNRNHCIEFISKTGYENLIIEDQPLLDKWSNIFEEYINKDLPEKVSKFINTALGECYNKNLYREFKMKKILPEKDDTV